jgi:hypothetical protein
LGGDKWRAQYDNLLKNIQIALKEEAKGLAALKSDTTPTPASNKKAPAAKGTPSASKAPAAGVKPVAAGAFSQ